MVDASGYIAAAKEIISSITNIGGIIDDNLASYDKIQARFRRKRLVKRLEGILRIVNSWDGYNGRTMSLLQAAKYMKKGQSISRYMNDIDLSEFSLALLDARELIDQYSLREIRIDYTIFEELHGLVDGRRVVIGALESVDEGNADKLLLVLIEVYGQLMRETRRLKEKIQKDIIDAEHNP